MPKPRPPGSLGGFLQPHTCRLASPRHQGNPQRGPGGVPGGGQFTLAPHGAAAASGTLSFLRTLSPEPEHLVSVSPAWGYQVQEQRG